MHLFEGHHSFKIITSKMGTTQSSPPAYGTITITNRYDVPIQYGRVDSSGAYTSLGVIAPGASSSSKYFDVGSQALPIQIKSMESPQRLDYSIGMPNSQWNSITINPDGSTSIMNGSDGRPYTVGTDGQIIKTTSVTLASIPSQVQALASPQVQGFTSPQGGQMNPSNPQGSPINPSNPQGGQMGDQTNYQGGQMNPVNPHLANTPQVQSFSATQGGQMGPVNPQGGPLVGSVGPVYVALAAAGLDSKRSLDVKAAAPIRNLSAQNNSDHDMLFLNTEDGKGYPLLLRKGHKTTFTATGPVVVRDETTGVSVDAGNPTWKGINISRDYWVSIVDESGRIVRKGYTGPTNPALIPPNNGGGGGGGSTGPSIPGLKPSNPALVPSYANPFIWLAVIIVIIIIIYLLFTYGLDWLM